MIKEQALIERHAEHRILRYFNGANPTHIARMNNQPVSCIVYDKKGTAIELQFGKICNERAWDKYQKQLGSPLELGVLTNNVGPIVCDVMQWVLDGGYSERYKYIKSKRARVMLRFACFVMVITHIVKCKHETHGFVDEWVENEVGKIITAQSYADEIHKATGHALKHGEDLAQAQEDIYHKYLSLLENRPHIPYMSLPALPEGVSDPLALPEDEGDEDD